MVEPSPVPATTRVSPRMASVVLSALSAAAIGLFWLHFAASADWPMSWGFVYFGLTTTVASSYLALTLIGFGLLLWLARNDVRSDRARLSWAMAVPLVVVAGAAFALAGWLWPTKALTLDSAQFIMRVRDGVFDNTRWYLTILLFHGVEATATAWVPKGIPVPLLNATFTGGAYAAMGLAALRLSPWRFDRVVIVALAFLAFGNVQLGLWYKDVYPVLQFFMAAFLWTSLRAVDGDGSPAWPLSLAAIGPFFHPGLILLLPPAGLLAVDGLLRPPTRRGTIIGAAIAILCAGLATLPGWGFPFAFGAWLDMLAATSLHREGLSSESSLLPFDYLVGVRHLRSLWNGFVLLDGPGILSCLVAGPVLLLHRLGPAWDVRPWILGLLAGGSLAYSAVMDPLYGPYLDWDLFSFTTVATSLFGAYAFVVVGRESTQLKSVAAALLIGVSALHLGARLNKTQLEKERLMEQSPIHAVMHAPREPGKPPPGNKGLRFLGDGLRRTHQREGRSQPPVQE